MTRNFLKKKASIQCEFEMENIKVGKFSKNRSLGPDDCDDGPAMSSVHFQSYNQTLTKRRLFGTKQHY